MKVLVTAQVENITTLTFEMITFFINHAWDVDTEIWINQLAIEMQNYIHSKYSNLKYKALVMVKELKY